DEADDTDDEINPANNHDAKCDSPSEIHSCMDPDLDDGLEPGGHPDRASLAARSSLAAALLEIEGCTKDITRRGIDSHLRAAGCRSPAGQYDLHRAVLAAGWGASALYLYDQQRRARRHAESHERLRQTQRRERAFALLQLQRQPVAAIPQRLASS